MSTATVEKPQTTVEFPIRAYNARQDNESVVIPDADPRTADPELRERIKFHGGSYQVKTQREYDALAGKPGIYFEDFPRDAPDRFCPHPKCGRPFRNLDALDAHARTHMSD